MGATASAASAHRPAITTSAPVASASRQREGAQVDVGAENAVANRGQAARRCRGSRSGWPLASRSSTAVRDVVSQHHGHFQLRSEAAHFARAGQRVDAAGVGDHLDIPLPHTARQPRHQRREIARVAQGRVLPLLLLQDRHGDLGQVVEGQIVDGPLLDQAHRRLEPIAPEALSVRDANHRSAISRQLSAVSFQLSNTKCSRCRWYAAISRPKLSTSRERRGSMTASAWPRAAP